MSPDLNVIEHIWAYLKDEVERRQPSTIEELKQFIEEQWNLIPQEFINNLYS